MEFKKESALTKIAQLVDQISDLQKQKRFSEAHTFWIAETLRFLEKIFGKKSRYYLTFSSFTWGKRGQFIVGGPSHPEESFNPQRGIDRVHQEAYLQELKTARGLLSAAKNELIESDLKQVYRGDNISTIEKSKNINYWNYINPIWLLWKVLVLAWQHKIITTVITGLIIAYITFVLGWDK